MTTIAASTKEKALSTLDNMTEMISLEMLIHGHYVNTEIVRPERVGKALCNGQQYCAMGTMYISYGVQPDRFSPTVLEDGTEVQVGVSLPGTGRGTTPNGRDKFTARRPGLGLVYRTLKRLSQEYALAHGWGPELEYTDTEREREVLTQDWHNHFDIEDLFESCLPSAYGYDEEGNEPAPVETRRVMLDLVAAARKEIEGLPVAS